MAREMKDSGIEWIGEIPQEWKTIKVKYTSWLKGRIGWQGLTASEYVDEGPFLVTGTDFQNGGVNWSSCAHITKERFDEDTDIHIKEGDLLITKDGTVGKVAIAKDCPEEVSLNSGVLLIRNVGKYKYHDKYLYYVLLSDEFWRWYTLSQVGQSTIKHLYQAQFYSFEYTYPPLLEQKRIADYLGTECARIDTVIEKTRASIEEYKKLKQSVITQAVTKGILPNRRMKDSGIEWIGDIPNSWIMPKVLQCLQMPITDGPHTTPELFDDGIPFVSAEAVSTGNGRINFDHMRGYISKEFYEECCKKYTPQIDDVYMIKSGATTGRVAIVDTDRVFTIWSPLAVFRADKGRILPMFLFYCLQADYVQKQIENGWTYGTQQNIGMRTLEKIKLCVPPVEEQSHIIVYLDEKIFDINLLIEKKEKLLSELENYKKSLIFEFVTGKKEVPS